MPGTKPKEKVKTLWSPKLAYAVGLITTDGNLSIDGRHINFTSKDRDQVKTFMKCLSLKNKIGRKGNGTNPQKKYFQVQFGDVLFYRWLSNIGLSPHKSKTLGELNIPNCYFFDFLRGCFDGDGCISGYWDKRWHSSYMYYLRFVSASLNHIEWLHKTTQKLSGAIGKIRNFKRSYELAFAKKATKILFNKMYYSADIPYLKRKFAKAEKIFRVDDKHNAQVAELADAPA